MQGECMQGVYDSKREGNSDAIIRSVITFTLGIHPEHVLIK